MTGCALVSGLSNLDVEGSKGSDASTADGGLVVDGAVDSGATDVAISPDVTVIVPDGGCGCGLTVPAGFSAVLYGSDGDNCPNSATKENIVTSPQILSGANGCTCGCTLGGCTNMKLSLYQGASCQGLIGTATANNQCQASPNGYALTTSVKLAGQGSGNVTCSTPSSYPKPYANQAALCSPSSSNVCANLCQPPNGMATCFVATGDVACPVEAPKRTVIAKSVTDTRTCLGCTCNVTNPVCNVNLQWFSDPQCTTAVGNSANFASETCVPASASSNLNAKVTPGGNCSVTGSTGGTGTTTPVNVRTVCCK